jgi:hypothetical protein
MKPNGNIFTLTDDLSCRCTYRSSIDGPEIMRILLQEQLSSCKRLTTYVYNFLLLLAQCKIDNTELKVTTFLPTIFIILKTQIYLSTS